MVFVYILKSLTKNKYYIGCTKHLEKRIHEHNNGFVKSTKSLLPLKLEIFQEYDNLSIARKIEFKLKKLKRKDYISKIIKEGFIKMVV